MSDIKLIFREQMDDYINPLKEKGCNVWSISRLNNFNTCKKQYYNTYIARNQQKAGVYGILGTACHSDLEDLYEGKNSNLQANNFKDEWLKCEMFGVDFPKSRGDIKGNYKKDIDTFYKYYEKMEGKFISELGFILKIDDLNYLMGYIDLIELLEDDKARIYDFKTSAMFKDKKLIEAGRQLAIYQMAMEELYKLKVDLNGWIMLKYVDVTIGNNKTKKALQNKDLISKCETQINKLMKSKGYSQELIDIYMMKCSMDNDFKLLPEDVLTEIQISTHFKPYEVTSEVKEETLNYIKRTICEIESLDKDNESLWECSPNDFFCRNLCGFYPKYCNIDIN